MLYPKWTIVFVENRYHEEIANIESNIVPRKDDRVVLDGKTYFVYEVRFNLDNSKISVYLDDFGN